MPVRWSLPSRSRWPCRQRRSASAVFRRRGRGKEGGRNAITGPNQINQQIHQVISHVQQGSATGLLEVLTPGLVVGAVMSTQIIMSMDLPDRHGMVIKVFAQVLVTIAMPPLNGGLHQATGVLGLGKELHDLVPCT